MTENDDVNDFKFMNESLKTTGYNIAERLEENFWFLMNLVEKDVKDLNDHMRIVVSKWFMRLATFADGVNVAKLAQRNFYLGQLIDCIQEKRFTQPFNAEPPEQGDLPMIDTDPEWLDDQSERPDWLEEVLKNAPYRQSQNGAKNFETFLSTKFFENERGACAYIAVSATNEGDKSAWVRMKTNADRDKKLEEVFDKELELIEQALQKSLMEFDSNDEIEENLADLIDLGTDDSNE